MKLLQYRFPADAVKEASYIGQEVEAFFCGIDDSNLMSIKSSHRGIVRGSVNVGEIARIVTQSFEQSYEMGNIDYEKYVSIRSSKSCRFLVFEDDGLLRICFSNVDSVILFSKLSPKFSDESRLLIETDLFDFL